MSTPYQSKVLFTAMKVMILIAICAILYVILQSTNPPKKGLMRWANGELSKLQVLADPPAQPNFTFQHPGGEMRLSDFRGKLVIMNIWATWCAPCIEEIPSLNRLAASQNENLNLVTISIDRTLSEAKDFLERANAKNLVPYHDGTRRVSAAVNAPALPITIIYSRTGREMARIYGAVDWQSTDAQDLVAKLIQN